MRIGKMKKQADVQRLSDKELREQKEFEELKERIKQYETQSKGKDDFNRLPFTVCGL